MQSLHASRALLPDGWAADVAITVDHDGTITAVQTGAEPVATRLAGPVVPGLPNLHSHAFQRAMAGLAERGSGEDSFWGWRELMYRFLARLTPDDVEAIATQLYVEMLRAGYTAVGEFHYLCRAPDGHAYDDPAAMAERIAAAAHTTGIGLTLLPVIYTRGGFDEAPLAGGQLRFRQDADEARDVAERMLRRRGGGQLAVGVAPHSLRACTRSDLAAALDGLDPAWPVHIHAAEQQQEVQGALATLGARPVAHLLDAGLDRRWCVVHATHMDDAELTGLAASGAVAGLCPTTEANLGDGLFRAREYLALQGRFGIGSDSHVSTNPAEELRLLEYGQRLLLQRRAVLAGPGEASTGGTLYRAALDGGAAALGRPIGRITPGCRADLVVLDPAAPSLIARDGDALLDGWLFAASACPVRDVMVGGRMVVQAGRHIAEEAILARYAACLRRLLA